MDEKILKSLYDIKLAIEEIDLFVSSVEKTFADYSKNILLRRGVERNLEIIRRSSK